MLIIGLTGGIASGKSTIADYLRRSGIPVVDADQLARDIVKVGKKAYLDIIQTFGDSILNEDRTLNRSKLAQIVFQDPDKLAQLNAITHPEIAHEAQRIFNNYEKQGYEQVIYDVPLLFENNLQSMMDAVILVAIPPELQLERLLQRDSISKEEALRRIRSQMPLDEKKKLTPYIIDNSGTIEDSIQQLRTIWSHLTHSPLSPHS